MDLGFRALVGALLAAGIAVGTPPAAAKSESPARVRYDTTRVQIGSAEAGTSAFVAWPNGQAAAPAVIVVHEWWGLDGSIRELARRLAQQGYVAIVPDLYHGKVATEPEVADELQRGLDADRARADLLAAVVWLRSQPRTGKSRIGVVGFSMGGSLALDLALARKGLAAAVVFYGTPETRSERLAALGIPLQAHFGAEDPGIAVERVSEFQAALKGAGKTAEVFVYPGAGHAFMHEGRPSFHPDAARQAWARTLAFLQKNLKG